MLDLSLSLLLNTAITFLVLMVLLNTVLYKPLLGFMERREKSIKRDLENASRNSSDVESYYKEADSIISKAKAEAMKLKESAFAEIKDASNKKLEESKVVLDAKYSSYLEELEKQRVALKNSLLSQMPLYKDGVKIKISQI